MMYTHTCTHRRIYTYTHGCTCKCTDLPVLTNDIYVIVCVCMGLVVRVFLCVCVLCVLCVEHVYVRVFVWGASVGDCGDIHAIHFTL